MSFVETVSKTIDKTWSIETVDSPRKGIIVYCMGRNIDFYTESGWRHESFDKKSENFIPKKIRTAAERLSEEYFGPFDILPCPFCGRSATQDSSSGAHEEGSSGEVVD